MIRLDARLSCALELLRGARVAADIGCDHGKLTAALLLYGGCERVVAGDVSPDCLQKTRELIERLGLQNRAEARLGSGLGVLSPGECDAAAMLGMGGELMIELLEGSPETTDSLERLVLQPMSGVEELRRWLYEHEFRVRADRLTCVGRRWYQLICVQKGSGPDPWPRGFPEDCWLVGYEAFRDRDALLKPYCEAQMKKRQLRLKQAAGTAGEDRLRREEAQLRQILKEIEGWS